MFTEDSGPKMSEMELKEKKNGKKDKTVYKVLSSTEFEVSTQKGNDLTCI